MLNQREGFDVLCGVDVSVVLILAIRTIPMSVFQAQTLVDVAANMTTLRGRLEPADGQHGFALPFCFIRQEPEELSWLLSSTSASTEARLPER